MRIRSKLRIFLGFCISLEIISVQNSSAVWGEEPSYRDGAPGSAALSPTEEAPSYPAEIESKILALPPLPAQEQLSEIFSLLSHLSNVKQQDRLRRLLKARLEAPPENLLPSPPITFEEAGEEPHRQIEILRQQIELLNFGPDATVDDLRMRDQLVLGIAGIRDPVLQRQLLAALEEKERESQEVAADQPK